jgi:hypothetical protein
MPVVAVVAASLTLAGSLHAEWFQTAGPRGIRVNVFWKSANVVYAGTNAKGPIGPPTRLEAGDFAATRTLIVVK